MSFVYETLYMIQYPNFIVNNNVSGNVIWLRSNDINQTFIVSKAHVKNKSMILDLLNFYTKGI